ncbi:RING-type domain-containing protein [Chloropicon primus]|uniref:RING-type domain-containing protein n=1 Tax=Chloropicon primus TaxID=1764295 RepID=A0A5B8MG25_9CHLO|nr:hypothetical protein A3770_01p08080 [Chloropicon primus]UPQ97501.1 RING-type domain-containing protein [Chloropicon primus]|eukprot:QDZ18290.1 hypothetical protein A3770_01p08080 [Chloropicon primus]
MFAAAFTTSGSGGGVRYGFYFAPFLTLLPVLFCLLSMKEFAVIGKGVGFLAVIAVFVLTIKAVAGEAGGDALDDVLRLFVSPGGSGSFFTRDFFGLRNSRRRGRGSEQTRKRAERFDKVAETLQKLDTCVYEDREALGALSVSELKRRLRAQTCCTDKGAGEISKRRRKGLLVEKSDLVEKILEKSGTSGTMCVICYSEYENGDVQRILACGHRFHIECVDQWILKAAREYSKPPGCPMCNQPVVE